MSMPVQHLEPPKTKTKTRFSISVPFLVSLIVHGVIVLAAGLFVVRETVLGPKKAFEAADLSAPSQAVKEIEHRLQIARKAGGAASASPVSAQRILSASAAALAMPPLPEMAALSSGNFGGGFGGIGSGVTMQAGSGLGTAVGSAGLAGARGFASLSFLGITSQRIQKVVFVVDVSRDLMDIRKGGFRAFGIIRDEIMKLVTRLPPNASFSVILFGGGANDINLFGSELTPANVANKDALIAWLKPVNADPDKLGTHSALTYGAPQLKRPAIPGLDEGLMVPNWARAVRAALELKPDTIFLVTGSGSTAQRRKSDEELATAQRKNDDRKDRLRRDGIDPEGIAKARNASLAKARRELAEVNAQLRARGKQPYIISDTKRIFQPDFQAALKRSGFSIELDTTGWSDAQGKPIWELGVGNNERVEFAEVLTYFTRLQSSLLREKAAIHALFFVGPDEHPKDPVENLTALAQRNGGRFELLTAKRLEELTQRESSKASQ